MMIRALTCFETCRMARSEVGCEAIEAVVEPSLMADIEEELVIISTALRQAQPRCRLIQVALRQPRTSRR